MDKKAKKKIDVLHKRITKLRQQLAGAIEQMDDPQEVENLNSQIRLAEEEIEKWKAS